LVPTSVTLDDLERL